MRAVVPVICLSALLGAGCSGPASTADVAPLADQADRVAELLEQDRPCEAASAIATLAAMADGDAAPGVVREAVTDFTTAAQSNLTCDQPTARPSERETPGEQDRPTPRNNEGHDDEGEEDEGKPGKGKGRDHKGDEDEDDD